MVSSKWRGRLICFLVSPFSGFANGRPLASLSATKLYLVDGAPGGEGLSILKHPPKICLRELRLLLQLQVIAVYF